MKHILPGMAWRRRESIACMNECTKYVVIGVREEHGNESRVGVQAYPEGFFMAHVLHSIAVLHL